MPLQTKLAEFVAKAGLKNDVAKWLEPVGYVTYEDVALIAEDLSGVTAGLHAGPLHHGWNALGTSHDWTPCGVGGRWRDIGTKLAETPRTRACLGGVPFDLSDAWYGHPGRLDVITLTCPLRGICMSSPPWERG